MHERAELEAALSEPPRVRAMLGAFGEQAGLRGRAPTTAESSSSSTLRAGLAVLLSVIWALALLPAVLLAVRRIAIDREERYLEAEFGEEYRAYRRRVRRWL